jgi:hypothetical protein
MLEFHGTLNHQALTIPNEAMDMPRAKTHRRKLLNNL